MVILFIEMFPLTTTPGVFAGGVRPWEVKPLIELPAFGGGIE